MKIKSRCTWSDGYTLTTGTGPRNVWIGAQATYNLASGEFVDNFGASGKGLIEILGPKES